MNGWIPLIRSPRQVRFPALALFERIFADTDASRDAGAAQAWMPAIDVAETPREIVVQAEVPGMDKKDLEITLSDGLLTLRGEKRAQTGSEDARHLRTERRYGRFSRTLRIAATVEVGAIDANYKDGLLTVRLPKRPAEQRRRVPIQTADSADRGRQN